MCDWREGCCRGALSWLAALYDGVVKKIGGKENLQGEVKIIDNCFVAQDGIHFVFNEYEVACYAAGAIEVVVSLR